MENTQDYSEAEVSTPSSPIRKEMNHDEIYKLLREKELIRTWNDINKVVEYHNANIIDNCISINKLKKYFGKLNIYQSRLKSYTRKYRSFYEEAVNPNHKLLIQNHNYLNDYLETQIKNLLHFIEELKKEQKSIKAEENMLNIKSRGL